MSQTYYHIFRYRWARRLGIIVPTVVVMILAHIREWVDPCRQGEPELFCLIFFPLLYGAGAAFVAFLAVGMLLDWADEDDSNDHFYKELTRDKEITNE